MYKIDLLRRIEANTRGGAVSDCYSKYDLWRMIERNTRSKPNPPYQLDNGTWDMSNRELVKFSRSTKAWLDGKEYAPDEPRYTKDGELLIEGQATNLNVNDYLKASECVVTQGDKFKTVACSRADYGLVSGVNLASSANPTVTPAVFSFDIKATDANNAGSTVTAASWDGTNGNQWYDPITLSQSWLRVSILSKCDALFLGLYFSNDGNTSLEVSFDIKNIQREVGTVATSYIPTTTTAVTRAADIATVRDK